MNFSFNVKSWRERIWSFLSRCPQYSALGLAFSEYGLCLELIKIQMTFKMGKGMDVGNKKRMPKSRKECRVRSPAGLGVHSPAARGRCGGRTGSPVFHRVGPF